MTVESTQTAPRSRRALLAGAIGGLGVWAASAIGRAAPAEAAAGDPIRMGRLNKAASTGTTLQTSTSKPAFWARQLGGGHALRAEAGSGRAVMATAGNDGTGVWVAATDHIGVFSGAQSGVAVHAQSSSGIGVQAFSDNSIAVLASGATGLLAFGHPTAAHFDGSVVMTGWQEIRESAAPAPAESSARLFAQDNGSGKTQLCVRFPTGAVQVLATEP